MVVASEDEDSLRTAGASIQIFGFSCAPHEISEILGLTPTTSWAKGDPIRQTAIAHKGSGWILDSGLPEREDVDDHLDALLRRVSSAIDRFDTLPDDASIDPVSYTHLTLPTNREV